MILLDLIYPPRCTFCHSFVKNGKIWVCDDCKKDLPFTTDNGRQKVSHLTGCVAPLRYEKHVKESLHRFKFDSCTGYAKVYAPYIAECILDAFDAEFDVLSFVPISRKRKKHRGYDQSALLANAVGKLLGVHPIRTLRKVRNNPPQSLVDNPDERRKNVAGAYRPFRPDRFSGKRVLLIDDIVTTGSTVSECAKTLKSAGAEEVMCAAVARAGI